MQKLDIEIIEYGGLKIEIAYLPNWNEWQYFVPGNSTPFGGARKTKELAIASAIETIKAFQEITARKST